MENYYPVLINHTLPENKTWLRTFEVACYLEISKSSVYRFSQKGKIQAMCFGYSVRILPADILVFENGAGIKPAITRMVISMNKKSPRSCVGGGQAEYQPGNPQYLVRFNSNTPRRKGKCDCSKNKKIIINYQTKSKILRRIK